MTEQPKNPHNKGNQFTNPNGPDVFDYALQKGHITEKIEKAKKFWDENSDECFVITTNHSSGCTIQMRYNGTRKNVATRRLFFYYVNGTAPLLGPSTCGTKGCCNPNHQRQFVATPRQDRDGNVVAAF